MKHIPPSKVEIRIVAGSLRGRKVKAVVHDDLRPTPQMVREALFSILGNAVPGRPFFDLFAGSGIVGLEALSRGAASVTFVERDFRLSQSIEDELNEVHFADRGQVVRGEVYRWARAWQAPPRLRGSTGSPRSRRPRRRPARDARRRGRGRCVRRAA